MKHGFQEIDQKFWKKYKIVFEVFLKIFYYFSEKITDNTLLNQFCQCMKLISVNITQVGKNCMHALN